MAHPVNWFQISGKDAKGLQSFYKAVFGWKMSPAPDGSGMAMVSAEEGGINGGIASTMDGSSNNVAVYIGVPNLEAHLAKIKKAGGKTALDPMELPKGMGRIAGFADPSGNWIGLWQPGTPAKAASAKKAAPARKKAAKKAPKKAAAKPKKKARKKK